MISLELNASVTQTGRSKFNVKAKGLLVWRHNLLIKVEIYVFVKYRSDRSSMAEVQLLPVSEKQKGSGNLKVGHVTPSLDPV